MVKIVDVYSDRPIDGVINGTIVGKVMNISLSSNQIYTLMARGATVNEILSNGEKIPLTNRNYNTDNNPVKKVVVDKETITKAEEIITEQSAQHKAEDIAAKIEDKVEVIPELSEASKEEIKAEAKPEVKDKRDNNKGKSSNNSGKKNDDLQK